MELNSKLLALFSTINKKEIKVADIDVSQFVKELPKHERKGRGLSKEMKDAQEAIKRLSNQDNVWYPIKECKNNSLAHSTANAMKKSPNWQGFEIKASGVKVYVKYLG